jgi:phage I-like protein
VSPVAAELAIAQLNPEKEQVIQRLAFDTLLQLLGSEEPSTPKLITLEEYQDKINGPALQARMQNTIGAARFDACIQA